jgi:glycerol-3-phosphate dehydrogenase subunit C
MLVAEQVYDFNEFILKLMDEGTLDLDLQPIPLDLPYHAPCQYRAHRIGRPAVEVMDLIPGLNIDESHADCCGIAGTYGYKVEKYPIAMAVGSPLFDFINASSAPLAVCDSETCRWQITHGTGLPAVHPVELLSAAYGYAAENPLAGVLESQGIQLKSRKAA